MNINITVVHGIAYLELFEQHGSTWDFLLRVVLVGVFLVDNNLDMQGSFLHVLKNV
jgi:hypothetical protein